MRPTAFASIAACLCLACFSRQTVRPDELDGQPVILQQGRLDVQMANGGVQRIDAPVKAWVGGKTLLIKPQDGWTQLPLDRVVELTLVQRSPNRTAVLVVTSVAIAATIAFGVVFAATWKGPVFSGPSFPLSGLGGPID